MSSEHEPENTIAELFEVTPDGIYIDGHKLPVTDELTVEHAAPDLHIVSLKLYAKNFMAAQHYRVSKTDAATYRYVHDAPGAQT